MDQVLAGKWDSDPSNGAIGLSPEQSNRVSPDLGRSSRRQFLAGAATAVAALALPPTPVAEALPVPPVASKPPLPTWIVGTPGESDHEVIRALTREAAIRFRAEECEDDDEERPEGHPCDCYACAANSGYEATRVEQWDGKPQDTITDGDWFSAGFDARCERCDDECGPLWGGHLVKGVVVCDECMGVEDWEIIDPTVAAEMRAELEAATALAPSLSGRTV